MSIIFYRNKIIECLMEFEVPDKLIRLTVLTLTHTRARFKVNRDFTEEFIVNAESNKEIPYQQPCLAYLLIQY